MLAYQRYGRGKAIALPIQDSWLWRMDAEDRRSNDTTHATFWRRLVRWLVDGVPDQVMSDDDRRTASSPASREADRRGARRRLRRGQRRARDRARDVAVGQDHRGAARVDRRARRRIPHERSCPTKTGIYDVSVDRDARSEGARHRRRCTCASRPATRSTSTPAMRAPLLQRIAEETGGRFFTPADAAALPEAISYSGRGVTVVEERELWDMPALFLMLVGLIGGEWGYRRVRGLA